MTERVLFFEIESVCLLITLLVNSRSIETSSSKTCLVAHLKLILKWWEFCLSPSFIGQAPSNKATPRCPMYPGCQCGERRPQWRTGVALQGLDWSCSGNSVCMFLWLALYMQEGYDVLPSRSSDTVSIAPTT